MQRLTIIITAVLLIATGAFALDPSDKNEGALEIHRCTNNRFTRSVGVFGGRQPEFFLEGPDTRTRTGNDPRRQTDELTRVMDVTQRHGLSNPTAEPVIDKCRSWFRWDEREGLVKLTIFWDERNCTGYGTRDEPPDCRARAAFGFSLDELGIHEFPDTKQRRKALESRLERDFVADVYFSHQIRPRARRPDTGLWMPARAEVHLVARVIPLRSPDEGSGTLLSSHLLSLSPVGERAWGEGDSPERARDYQLMRKPVVHATPE